MIDIDAIFPKHFYRGFTGSIEEFTIVRYDDISSLPSVFEIVFEPFNTREINKIRWFIEEKKIRSRKEYLGKGNLGSFASRHFCEWSFEKMKNPYSTRDSFHIILVRISSNQLISLYCLRIGDIFARFSQSILFLFNGFFEFSNFREGITELVSDRFRLIHKMDLFQISECYPSNILNAAIIFTNLS